MEFNKKEVERNEEDALGAYGYEEKERERPAEGKRKSAAGHRKQALRESSIGKYLKVMKLCVLRGELRNE